MGDEGEEEGRKSFQDIEDGQQMTDAVEELERKRKKRNLGLSVGRFIDFFCENSF